ncbi:patatin-domain-containing protein, partial [Tothia fuscella]
MSFLHDTVLPGTARFRNERHSTSVTSKVRRLRKYQSSGSLLSLSPLVHLVRNPVGTIGDILGSLREDSTSTTDDATREVQTRRKILYLRLKEAETYEEWRSAACGLDKLEGNEEWKREEASSEYDAVLVQTRLRQLDEARINCHVSRMLFLIRTSLTRGLGGMGDLRLYKHSRIGTKSLIERYIEATRATINVLLKLSDKEQGLESRFVLEQLLAARQAFGRSALLLSGGGTFGMNHIGVVKSLWEAKLLPRIISGSSAGSIVCAVICAKTDAEVPGVIDDFCYGDLAVFEKEGEDEGVLRKVARFLKFGSIFDISHLERVMQDMLGDLTFQEAYNRTRRILNISVSSESIHEMPRLLNYITAPNVMIWSAVAASCSVPFFFSSAQLLAKDPRTGEVIPWNPSPQRWIDGSVDNDLPMTRLAEMFNVNHFIVCQVNPHVIPFLSKEEELIAAQAERSTSAVVAGPGWLHTLSNLAKGEALHRMQVLAELGIFPNLVTKAQSILSQKYSGDITILPEISYAHFPRILKNPDIEFMLQAMLCGERATWPKLSRIQNHCAIELALDAATQQLRSQIVFSPSQVDLR